METYLETNAPENNDVNNGLSIKDLFLIIKNHIIAICLIIVICLGLGFTYTKVLQKPQYESNAIILVSVSEKQYITGVDKDGNPTYSILSPSSALQFASQLKTSLIKFIKTRRVRLEVLKDIQEDIKVMTNETLKSKILITFPNIDTLDYASFENDVLDNTQKANMISSQLGFLANVVKCESSTNASSYDLFINVSFTSQDKEVSRYVLNRYIDTVEKMSLWLENEGTDQERKFFPDIYDTLRIVDSATLGSKVSKTAMNLAISFLIGAVLAVIYVLLKEISEDKFKSKDEVERILKTPVLGYIPTYDVKDDE